MNDRNEVAGRIVYITLTAMAVVILCVTLYTFFGAARRQTEGKTSPETTGAKETTAPVTLAPHQKDPVRQPEETDEVPGKKTEADDPAGEDSQKEIDKEPEESAQPVDGTPLGSRVLLWPVTGPVSKAHDLSTTVFSLTMNDYRVHCGVDIEGFLGDAVRACGAGVITQIEQDPFMGTCVTMDLGGGLCAVYRNLSEALPDGLAVGTVCTAGQTIGAIGESAALEYADAPHLHFELQMNGTPIDPLSMLDPAGAGQPVYSEP